MSVIAALGVSSANAERALVHPQPLSPVGSGDRDSKAESPGSALDPSKESVDDVKELHPLQIYVQPHWTEETLHHKLADRMIEVIREVNIDTDQRLAQNSLQALERGVFKVKEYYLALDAIKRGPNWEAKSAAAERIAKFQKEAIFRCGCVPSEFDRSNGIQFYILNHNVLASDGLKALKQGLTFLQPDSLINVARYEALREVLGDRKFNLIFNHKNEAPLVIYPDYKLTPLLHLVKTRRIKHADIKRGQQCSVKGVVDYMRKHCAGEASFAVLCADDVKAEKKFVGYGLPPEGVGLKHIQSKLFDDYNTKSLGLFTFSKDYKETEVTAFKQLLARNRTQKISEANFKAETEDPFSPNVYDFRMDRVLQLVNSKESECAKLFKTWHVTDVSKHVLDYLNHLEVIDDLPNQRLTQALVPHSDIEMKAMAYEWAYSKQMKGTQEEENQFRSDIDGMVERAAQKIKRHVSAKDYSLSSNVMIICIAAAVTFVALLRWKGPKVIFNPFDLSA